MGDCDCNECEKCFSVLETNEDVEDYTDDGTILW